MWFRSATPGAGRSHRRARSRPPRKQSKTKGTYPQGPIAGSGGAGADRIPHEKRIEVDLLDLDAALSERPGVKVSVRPASRPPQIAAFLKRQFCANSSNNGGISGKGSKSKASSSKSNKNKNNKKQIHRDADVLIYLGEVQLGSDDEIPADAALLYYRVLEPGDDGGIRIHWTGRHLRLTPAQIDALQQQAAAACIPGNAAGQSAASVGGLRAEIARSLRESNSAYSHLMRDPNQVEIRAVGGLRPGPLHSNQWSAQNVSTAWLCRHMTVAIRPPGDFYIFRGFNEEYVWHCPAVDRYGHDVSVRGLKRWLERRVLTAVNCGDSSGGDDDNDDSRWQKSVDVRDISLLRGGGSKPLRDRDRLPLGSVVDFRLPRSVREDFVREEARLLPLSQACAVCAEDKRASDIPQRITGSCDHPVTTCRDCVAQWITSSLDSVTWDRVRCPECRSLLSFDDVQNLADPDTVSRHDELATKAVLGRIADFQWCLNPACGSGQIYPADCSRARCHECRRSACVRHGVPWHSGETCERFEQRTRSQQAGEQASTQKVKETTKPCPSCSRAVDKYTGCDHITCICGHEWCYLCLQPYTLDADYLLQCDHGKECTYYRNPPEYEGARPLFAFLNEPLDPRPLAGGVPLAPRPPNAALHIDRGEAAPLMPQARQGLA